MDVLNESDSRVALVTGANRGIGLATVRGLAERPNLSGLARLADGRACGGQPRPVYGGANTTSRARFSDISTKR